VVEHLTQVRDISNVGALRLSRLVRQLGHRLAVAAHELHDDIDRRERRVVGQLGADAEARHHAVGEMAVQVQSLGDGQRVREHEALGARIDAQARVMGQRFFAPHDRIARVVAQAVEQLGEIQVEVGQERVHANDIGQRRTQVAPVFLHPVLERGALEIDQARAEGLVRLQVFMSYGDVHHDPETGARFIPFLTLYTLYPYLHRATETNTRLELLARYLLVHFTQIPIAEMAIPA
jgi:hypothetical protein